MTIRRFLPFLIAASAAALLAACGGGGGGGGGGSESPVQYSGNSSAAVVTSGNASGLVANVFGSGDSTAIVTGLSVTEGGRPAADAAGGLIGLGRRLNQLSRNALAASRPAPGLVRGLIPVEETELCDSGSVRTFGTLNDDATGTLNVQYNDCRIGDETLSGQATLRIDAFDSGFVLATDFTFSFPRLRLRGTGLSVDIGGTLRTQLAIGSQTETITENLVSLDNLSGRMTKSENFVVVSVFDDLLAPSLITSSISGRIFDSVDGYVDISTLMPLTFGDVNQLFPGSGQTLLVGAGNRSVRVTALSLIRVRLDLDLDADTVYETRALLRWTDLSGPVGADLGDADGDGMHNAWETANGLSPSNAADAADDNDGDNATNLEEYEGGTDPNNAGSVPPPPPPPTFTGQVVSLADNSALIYDPVTQRIYAAVRGNPGTVVPIDPTTGVLGTAIPVGIDPVKLARSDDGQYLYVALDGEAVVQRIDLATQLVDLAIPLGSGDHGLRHAEDIAVLPGSSQSIAVSLKYKGVSPRHAGVAVFDGAVMRATVTPGHTGSNVIEFSASAGTLYGYNNETSEFGFRRMAVDASGVTVSDVFTSFDGDLIGGFGVDIKFHNGLIYTTTGRVIDPVARTVVGNLDPSLGFGALVEPDATKARVFTLAFDGALSTWMIRAYDASTLQSLGIEIVSGISGDPGTLLRWGDKGLAFRTSGGQVFLTDTSPLVP